MNPPATANKPFWLQKNYAWLIALLGVLLTPSCALVRLKQNVQQINAHGSVAVQVKNLSTTATNYALALRRVGKDTNEMVGFQTVPPDGLAVFLLRQNQTYAVGAFSDLNGNGQYDAGEPADLVREVRPKPLTDTTTPERPIFLTLTTTNDLLRGRSFVLPRENSELGEALSVRIGEMAGLDEPRFSAAIGEMGMWQPYEFMRRGDCGVYFLEKYDAKKLPVLFVYGISGSVQDWRFILDKLDRKKYQPWFFQYPGGFRLDKSANALATSLLMLKQRHHFEKVAVVAHSMGGLVSRGAIERAAELAGTNFISHFVSISTPWGGHQAANLGVKHLDFPVPAWRDMATGSAYLKEILGRPLPAGTRYDLIFGYKSSGGLGLPDENDGVVAVQSELVPQVQEEAASSLGLFEDHASILTVPATWHRVEQALAK